MNKNPLTNVLTPKARAVLYAALFVVALGFAAYEAADGDWLKAIALLVTSLLGATAASNASVTPVETVRPPDAGGHVVSRNRSTPDDYGYSQN